MHQDSIETTINLRHLGMLLGGSDSDTELFQAIVNLPFQEYTVATTFMFLGIIVLLLVNPDTGKIDRVALSNTEIAERTTDVSAKPFNDIKIDLTASENSIVKAVTSNQAQEVTDWHNLFVPELTAEEARLNQANAGIAYSVVQPFAARSGGALIFSYYQYKNQMDDRQQHFMTQYTRLVDQRLR